MDYGEENFSAWGLPFKKKRRKNNYPEPVECKTRMGEINDLLDEYIKQKKALEEVNKAKGGKKLISTIEATIINIEEKLIKLK